MNTEPQILLHPNIPKPLHGLNPRSIMGQGWWDVERQKAYASTDFHCLACGVEKRRALIYHWLEAHEYYKFDYSNGVIEIQRIIPLCHACHNYIHNGKLLKDLTKMHISPEVFWLIVGHGTNVLGRANLPNNPFMLNVLHTVKELGYHFPTWAERLLSSPLEFPEGGEDIAWEDWRLSFNGKLYGPIHASFQAWKEFYK